MAEVTNIEVFVGKEAPADSTDKTKESSATKPEDKGEVSGHYWTNRRMECWRCGGVSWIEYDTDSYHAYTCCYCHASNVL